VRASTLLILSCQKLLHGGDAAQIVATVHIPKVVVEVEDELVDEAEVEEGDVEAGDAEAGEAEATPDEGADADE